MATINYFVSAKKRENAPVYVRFSAGKQVDITVKTGLIVDPNKWSNDTQTLRQRINTDASTMFINKYKKLKDHIELEYRDYYGEYSAEWLTSIIDKFHNKKDADARTLNDYIDKFILDAKEGTRKNKSGMNFASGSIKTWEGFQRIFNEYQGVYTEKRITELMKKKKPLRPIRKLDFDDITLAFLISFKSFLTDEGYSTNTIWRFIKELKFFMQKSLDDKKHSSRDFQNKSAFGCAREHSYSVYLTEQEIENIYRLDLSNEPRMDIARDAFIVLCETALRVSDYSKIDLNIRERNGRKYIYLTQTKTGAEVIIPLTFRMQEILKKYSNELPRIPDQKVNQNIKIIAERCNINEIQRWETSKFGKKYNKTAKKFELISCHSGRRSACTNMYLAGIPIVDIMKISGHSSQKVFMDYIKITKEETAVRLSEHEYFNRKIMRVAN